MDDAGARQKHDLFAAVDRLRMISEVLKSSTLEQMQTEILPMLKETADQLEKDLEKIFAQK